MRIIEYRAVNVKGLKAFTGTLDQNLIIVAGRNGQGKSSLLDSVQYLFAGKDSIPERPVRDGAQESYCEATLSDGKVLRRDFIKNELTLRIDGKVQRKPQELIAAHVRTRNSLNFDPLALTRMKPVEQMAAIKAAAGLEFDDLDREAEAVYAERTLVNGGIKRLEAQLEAMPQHEDAGPVDAAEVRGRLLFAQDENSRRLNDKLQLEQAATLNAERAAEKTERRQKVLEQIKRLQAEAAELNGEIEQCVTRCVESTTEAESIEFTDTSDLEAAWRSADEANRRFRENEARQELADEAAAERKESGKMTQRLDDIKAEKQARIAAANLPVSGLDFRSDGIWWDERPLAQASTSQQIKMAAQIGIAAARKHAAASNEEPLLTYLIREGSLLDRDSLVALGETAQAEDAQFIVEVVGEDVDGVCVLVRDGLAEQQG